MCLIFLRKLVSSIERHIDMDVSVFNNNYLETYLLFLNVDGYNSTKSSLVGKVRTNFFHRFIYKYYITFVFVRYNR